MAMLDALLGGLAVGGEIAGRSFQGPEGEMKITGRGGARLSASGSFSTDPAPWAVCAPFPEVPAS
jgi:hypothetical protein